MAKTDFQFRSDMVREPYATAVATIISAAQQHLMLADGTQLLETF